LALRGQRWLVRFEQFLEQVLLGCDVDEFHRRDQVLGLDATP
jgi:hypothetical protein